jgi:hypothetical protein
MKISLIPTDLIGLIGMARASFRPYKNASRHEHRDASIPSPKSWSRKGLLTKLLGCVGIVNTNNLATNREKRKVSYSRAANLYQTPTGCGLARLTLQERAAVGG